MSAIAAKILGKHHAHVYQEVGHRHRLSYADLDALLDREEKQLAAEHKRQRAQLTDTNTTTTAAAVDTNTTLAGGHDHGHGHPGTRSSSSSIESSSSGSEDEADWHAGGEHEEDLLLELEETTHESIHTVTGAEDHLVQDIDHIVYVRSCACGRVRACGRVCAVLLTMCVRVCAATWTLRTNSWSG
jgi:hypothetical protein